MKKAFIQRKKIKYIPEWTSNKLEQDQKMKEFFKIQIQN